MSEQAEKKEKPPGRTSANSTPGIGDVVQCCGTWYVLCWRDEKDWWGANLGPDRKNPRKSRCLFKVPEPFLYVEKEQ